MSASRAGRRLIVNADDLGRSVGINDGIFEAHRRGIVTSATLMVTWAAAADAASRLAEHPALGVGLHVALTDGEPLSPLGAVPSLVGADGRFPRRPEGLGSAVPADVAREVRAQVAAFERFVGRPPTHFDSHHHSHRAPAVLEGLLEVARALAVPVRRASEAVARRLEAAGVATTDAFLDGFFGPRVGYEDLRSLIADLPHGTTELMCHPGRADDALRATSTYADPREAEIEALCDPRILRDLAAWGVERTHFGRLEARSGGES